MDLPRLLFDVGCRIFIVTPRMFTFSLQYVENVRLITTTASDAY